MLGETRGTSAGGAAEAGKFLRVPGTNPFFPLKHAQQGNRFWELLDSSPMEVFLLNTGEEVTRIVHGILNTSPAVLSKMREILVKP